MATIDEEGKINGTIGSMVFYQSRGLYLVRMKPYRKNKKARKNIDFDDLTRIGKVALDKTTKRIWRNIYPKQSALTNFIDENIDCFDRNGKIEKYDQLKFSIGNIELPPKFHFQVTINHYAFIKIAWDYKGDTRNCKSTDLLRIYSIYYDELLIVTGSKTRGDKTASIVIPFSYDDCIHLYLFFVDEKGENGSNCHYEEIKRDEEDEK